MRSDEIAALRWQIHIRSGDRQMGQTTRLTSSRTTELETGKDKGWDDQRGLHSSNELTYGLETGKDDGMG